jgi:hypothetical protein
MARGVSTVASLLSILTIATPAVAWAPETRVQMTDAAMQILPESLRLALERHRDSVLRGALTPLTSEDDADHAPPWRGGTLDARFGREVDALLSMLERPTRFDSIAEQFGVVAHFATDAGFPPGMSDGDGDSRYRHFAAFCESRREKFPLVFYGHDDPDLARDDYASWIRNTMHRAMLEDRTLSAAYAAAGDPPRSSAFDDRSVPFAVASLSYSRGVTDIVRVWLSIWAQAGGDTGRTPYRKRAPAAQKELSNH